MFVYIYNKTMSQLMMCSRCKKHYASIMNGTYECCCKTCNDCRHTKNNNNLRKKQASTSKQNNEDNISTKSSTQHSQSSTSNTLDMIANNTNTIQCFQYW